MSEITKPDYTYLWSSGGSIVAPSNVKIQTGWTAEVPPFQWENWSQNRQDQAIAHILQKGISVWSATGEYYFTASGERSYVQGSDGNIYVALQDSIGQNPVTDTTDTYWKLAFIDTTSLAASGSIIGEFLNLKMSVTAASTSASITADSVVVGSALNGLPYKLTSINKTINLATTGAGGMDVGVAPVSGFVSLYLIYNPITAVSALLACNQTTSSGTVYSGANMPSGYTASALVSAWRTNASSQFQIGEQLNRDIGIVPVSVVSTTVNQTNSAISVAAIVPTITKTIGGTMACSSTGSAGVDISLASKASTVGAQTVSVSPPSGDIAPQVGGIFSRLNLSETGVIYLTTSTAVGALLASAFISSYSI